MGRKRGYERKPFESDKPGSGEHDSYVGLYFSMTHSPAWRDLTAYQRDLYRICREQYMLKGPAKRYPEHKPFDRAEVFFLTWDMAKEDAPQKERTFYKDLRILAEHGFIRILMAGGFKRASIYELSDGWRRWKKGEGVAEKR